MPEITRKFAIQHLDNAYFGKNFVEYAHSLSKPGPSLRKILPRRALSVGWPDDLSSPHHIRPKTHADMRNTYSLATKLSKCNKFAWRHKKYEKFQDKVTKFAWSCKQDAHFHYKVTQIATMNTYTFPTN